MHVIISSMEKNHLKEVGSEKKHAPVRVEPLNSKDEKLGHKYLNCLLCRLYYVHTDSNQCLSILFWSQRVIATIKKRQRGFPLHFISFKMTANQETQVNASILSKTLQEYSILYAMTFLRNSFSRVDHHMSKNALFGKILTCILPL